MHDALQAVAASFEWTSRAESHGVYDRTNPLDFMRRIDRSSASTSAHRRSGTARRG